MSYLRSVLGWEKETSGEPEKKYFIPQDRLEELYWIIDELADKRLTQRYRLFKFIKEIFPSIKGGSISVNVDNIEKPYVLAGGEVCTTD